jgi:hypothetical protein
MDQYDYKIGQAVEIGLAAEMDIRERGVVTGIAPNRRDTDYFLVKYRDPTGREREEWFAEEELDGWSDAA